mmetsp:Transcript_20742/g.56013  ORF Transcript_20742/g.56013 Transcript_20742/m.56013 type:complete len:366 (+) Transcript_20742:2631-3728(+)
MREDDLTPGVRAVLRRLTVRCGLLDEFVQVGEDVLVEHDPAHGARHGLLMEGGPQPDLLGDVVRGHLRVDEAVQQLLRVSRPHCVRPVLVQLALGEIAPLARVLVHEHVHARDARHHAGAQVLLAVDHVLHVGGDEGGERGPLVEVGEEWIFGATAVLLITHLLDGTHKEGEVLLGAGHAELDGPRLALDGAVVHAHLLEEAKLAIGDEVLLAQRPQHVAPHLLRSGVGDNDRLRARHHVGLRERCLLGLLLLRRRGAVRGGVPLGLGGSLGRVDLAEELAKPAEKGLSVHAEVGGLDSADLAAHALEEAGEGEDDDEDKLRRCEEGDEDEHPRGEHGGGAGEHVVRGCEAGHEVVLRLVGAATH